MNDYRIEGKHLLVRGAAAIPVMGEAHYSRIPRPLWPVVLGQLRSMGVSIVSSYVFWNHHQYDEGAAPDFEGSLDLRAFIEQVHELGMDFSLRVGPWVHAEVRHGGLPDWVAQGPWRTRSNDPAYLQVVARWWSDLAAHLRGLRPAVLQIENELYDAPEHLSALKDLATEAGLVADLATATAWGGAQFDRAQFQPVYGGYPDTFWSTHSLGWEERCAIHYQFQGIRDDALIGADGRIAPADQPVDDSMRPYATCELGGGMTTSYHRRPTVRARDVGALGITKIGCGSVWQGWYMLAGGRNPMLADHPLNESVSIGAPNELPLRDYDFQAPIGAAGQVRESAHVLRAQHAMLATLGPMLATSTVRLHNDAAVRHAIRSWRSALGESGVVLFNHHQPHTPMGRVEGFQTQLPDGTAIPPRPVTVDDGDYGAWAFHFDLGSRVRMVSSDLMPVGQITFEGTPTWVFAQTVRGSACATVAFADGREEIIDFPVDSPPRLQLLAGDGADVAVVVLGADDLARVWLLDGRILISQAPLAVDTDGVYAVCDPQSSSATADELTAAGMQRLGTGPALTALPLEVTPQPPHHLSQQAAPQPAWGDSQVWRVHLPQEREDLDRVQITWRGNVLRVVRAGSTPEAVGEVLADQFWHADGQLVLSIAHLERVEALDLHVNGYRPDEILVQEQPDDVAVTSVTLLPVRRWSIPDQPRTRAESDDSPASGTTSAPQGTS